VLIGCRGKRDGQNDVSQEAALSETFSKHPDSWHGMMGSAVEILSIEPRGLNRVKSAAYVGVSPALFDEMVRDGRMPPPKRINSRLVWDRKQLDEAFDALPDREDRSAWDEEDAA
jgi:predicted DNA-binding transcriptional regulator AlpA